MTVDVPAGTPADQITFPGLSAPVVELRPGPITPAPTADARRRPSRCRRPRRPSPADAGGQTAPPATPGATAARLLAGPARRPRAPAAPAAQQTSTHKPSAPAGTPATSCRAVGGAAKKARRQGAVADPAAPDASTTPDASRSRSPAPRRSASRTSSSTSSGSRRSCCRSTRPPASSTACAGRSWPRSTRSRPTTAATSTSPPPAPSAGCSSCRRLGALRGRRQQGRRQGPVQPGRRDLRRRPLPQGRRRRHRTSASAIFAYNHADWYVDSVLLRARVIGGLPANLVGSLTGLTQGRFPVAAKRHATPTTSVREPQEGQRGHATPRRSTRARRAHRHQDLLARGRARRSPSSDGAHRAASATSKRLGRFVDAAGRLRQHVHVRAAQERRQAATRRRSRRTVSQQQITRELALPKTDAAPTRRRPPATARLAGRRAGDRRAEGAGRAGAGDDAHARRRAKPAKPAAPAAKSAKERLFANPFRPNSTQERRRRPDHRGQGPARLVEVFRAGASRVFGVHAKSKDLTLKPLKKGARVMAGTVLGRIGIVDAAPPRTCCFEIRPAGKGAPRIDPKPILDGWKLLESTAIYRAAGKNPFFGSDAGDADDRPDPADEQGGAAAPGARRPARADLRLRPPRHPPRR